MKLFIRIFKVLFIVVGIVLTYGSPIIDRSQVSIWNLDWGWWTLIGATILFVVLGIIILQLHLDIKRLTSEDANRDRKIKQLELEKLEDEKRSREQTGVIY